MRRSVGHYGASGEGSRVYWFGVRVVNRRGEVVRTSEVHMGTLAAVHEETLLGYVREIRRERTWLERTETINLSTSYLSPKLGRLPNLDVLCLLCKCRSQFRQCSHMTIADRVPRDTQVLGNLLVRHPLFVV